MEGVTKPGRVGLALGLAALVVGLGFAGGSALVAGGWGSANEPYIGIGLNLMVVGLAATGICALVLDMVEPLGWMRLIAVPPALLLAAVWTLYVVFGMPTTGLAPGPERDIRTILYSEPRVLVWLVALTLLVAAPLAIRRVWRSRQA